MQWVAEGPDNVKVQFANFFVHIQNIFLAQRPAVFKLLDNR